MAIYNALGEKSLNAVLQQRLNMMGDAPAPALVPEIGSQIVLESDRPEWGRWKDELPWGMYVSQAAVAGEYSSVVMYPAPGKVLVITEIALHTAFPLTVGWRTAAVGYTLPIAAQQVVSRDNNVPQAIHGALSGTSAVLPQFNNGNLAFFARITTQTQRLQQPIILWPGGPNLLIRDFTANQAMQISLYGYLRTLTPNELG